MYNFGDIFFISMKAAADFANLEEARAYAPSTVIASAPTTKGVSIAASKKMKCL